VVGETIPDADIRLSNNVRSGAMRDGWDYVAVCDVQLIEQTDRAGLFLIEGEEVWIPWSQIDENSMLDEGEDGDIYIRRWIAIEKGLPFVD
jgi:hypothetical protein